MIAPNSIIRLLSGVRLDANYENTRMFSTATVQASYFSSKAFRTFEECTYIRESRIIKIQAPIDEIYLCNYVMYRNTNHSSKWFYAFVTKLEYINDNVTALHVQLDIMQTWMFDITWQPSFIEREHRTEFISGVPVVNTVDEGIDFGEDYQIVEETRHYPHGDIYFMLITSTVRLTAASDDPFRYGTTKVNGVTSPLWYYLLPMTDNDLQAWTCNSTVLTSTFETLYKLRTHEKYVNAIVSMTILPILPFTTVISPSTHTISSASIYVDSDTNISLMRVMSSVATRQLVNMADKYSNFPSYECSKLYMFPYSYTQLVDYQGNTQVIKNEYISGAALQVDAQVGISHTPKMAYIPKNYHGEESSLDHALISSYVSDMPIVNNETAAYMQSNRNADRQAITTGIVFGAMGGAARGFASAGGAGMIGGALGGAAVGTFQQSGQIAQLIAKKKDIRNIPDNLASQGFNSAFDAAYKYYGLWLIKKTVKPEYAKKLQDYFKRFGYKVNEIKLPNLNTRSRFNYVKTVGANIIGSVPQEDLMEIRSVFDKGVTLWHVEIDNSIENNT